MWRAARYEFDFAWMKQYQKNIRPSEPADDFDDRNALYSLSVMPLSLVTLMLISNRRDDLNSSALYKPEHFRRESVYAYLD